MKVARPPGTTPPAPPPSPATTRRTPPPSSSWPSPSDVISSMGKKARKGTWSLLAFVGNYALEMLRSAVRRIPYQIKSKTAKQVIADFQVDPYRVSMAFIRFYKIDDNKAEALLLEIVRQLKAIELADQRALIGAIDEAVAHLVFPSDLLKIRAQILEAEADWEPMQRFTAASRGFEQYQNIVFKDSVGNYIFRLMGEGKAYQLSYQQPFQAAVEEAKKILSAMLTTRIGREVPISRYPFLQRLVEEALDLLENDEFSTQRLWTTASRVVTELSQ